MSLSPQIHPTYRSDIDGLRAVAVISVILFHTFPEILPGGFTGVDIFFVISGFLISTILYSNLATGHFSMLDFYGRRIRRIFPALILVMVACYALGWFVLLPNEYAQLGKHIAGGAGFVQNFVLWNETGYFDNAAETKPLLHLWSLGIEEQFYIIWPILLWIGYRLRLNLLSLTLVIAIVSFVLNIRGINVTKDLVATFYSPQTRFWELLIGATAAYLTLYPSAKLKEFEAQAIALVRRSIVVMVWNKDKQQALQSPSSTPMNNANLYSIAGVLILLLGMALVNKDSFFPGWWALMPTIGSVLMIIAGPTAIINRTLLSNRMIVALGLISYPLYLWHWAILAFLRITEGEVAPWWLRAVVVLVAVVLSILTYQLIEKPIQFGKFKIFLAIKKILYSKFRKDNYLEIKNNLGTRFYITSALIFLTIAVGFVGFNNYKRDGLSFRAAAHLIDPLTFTFHFKHKCQLLAESAESGDWCNDGNSKEAPEIMLLGDSVATSYSQFLRSLAMKNGFTFKQFGRGLCPPLIEFGPTACQEASDFYYRMAEEDVKVKTIVLAAEWPMYINGVNYYWLNKKFTKEQFEIAFKKSIDYLSHISKKKIVVLLAPPMGGDPKKCAITRSIFRSDKLNSSCNLDQKNAKINDAGSREFIINILKDYPDIGLFDPEQFLCQQGQCQFMNGGKILYIDFSHLNSYGGEYLADKGGEAFMKLIDR